MLPRKRFDSIYMRMFAVICAAVIPTFLGLCFYVYQQYQHLVDYTKAAAENYASQAAHDERWMLNSTADFLGALSITPMIQARNWDLCGDYLRQLIRDQEAYVNIGVADPSGKPVCEAYRSPKVQRASFADRDYFQRALATRRLVVGNYQIGRLSHTPQVMVALPFEDHTGELIGVLYAALKPHTIMRARSANSLMPGAVLVALDRNGTVLNNLPTDPSLVGRPFADKELLAGFLNGEQSSGIVTRQGGAEWLVNVTRAGVPSDPDAITIVYQQPIAYLLSDINRSLGVAVVVVLLLSMLALLIGWSGIQAFVGRNISVLMAAAKRYGQRRFDTRLSEVLTGREFQAIGRQFDAMAHELAKQQLQWAASLERQNGQNRILRNVVANAPIHETLVELTHLAEEHSDFVVASIMLLDGSGKTIAICIAPSLPPDFSQAMLGLTIGPATGSCGTAMHEKRCVISPDIAIDPSWADYREFAMKQNLRSCWSSPIIAADEKVLGSMAFYSRTTRRPTLEELQWAQVMTELAAVAIEHQRQSHALEYQSQHDALTGLYNRSVVLTHLERAIARASQRQQAVVVLILDLDSFKEINDTLGHLLGDDLLRQVSERLASLETIGTLDGTIARSGGNEFTFVLDSPKTTSHIHDIIERILDVIRQPYLLDGIQVQISASAGVARYPDSGTTPTTLLLHAEEAMRQAKREGSGYVLHDASKEDTEPQRLLMLSRLRQALGENEFELYYQPKLSLSSGQVTGVEALLRWNHTERGLVSPDEFIPTLELSDLIHPVTLWVVETSIRQCKAWHDAGHPLTIAANVSTRNLLDTQLPEKVDAILKAQGLAARFLELEITESAIMADPVRSLDVLRRLHNIGVRIAIDDFGTGYSSLAYLQKLPVDNLKIDRSFVADEANERGSQSIVGSIIGLAHNLGVSVTAEGVETDAMMHWLHHMGCDNAQGYFIGRPMVADALTQWLAQPFSWAAATRK